jgi:ribosome-binding protein aMBF1 (putative translation factor)
MRCAICKKEDVEVKLFEGIFTGGMIRICKPCSLTEGIPTIRKPSEEQLERADERYSVRERMEHLSGKGEKTKIGKEQIHVQGNLAKLRIPGKKEYHPEVMDNYFWTLNLARRRKKLSLGQLAEKIGIDKEIINSIEKGKIPENFEENFLQLESFLGIKLLKSHKKKLEFTRTADEERRILETVREKIENSPIDEELDKEEEKKEILERISRGEEDFSVKENLDNVTLSDLVEMKRQREKREEKGKMKIQTDAMIGDDLDIDLDEFD